MYLIFITSFDDITLSDIGQRCIKSITVVL